jgi:SPX domain protein involved in polyphosphate accumulation
MGYQAIFERREMKYMITREQKEKLVSIMTPYMKPDKYGHSSVRNIYFDTDNYRLIRQSIEKPIYKEKLRIRSYGEARHDSDVFVELKKKYKHIVYKRRLSMHEENAMEWICDKKETTTHSQISNEIDYFCQYYQNLKPQVFLSYEREAYYSKTDDTFRVTFDENILCRQTDLTLNSENSGTPILPDDKIIMEIKCSGGIPMWMAHALSNEHIYKTSFSKYGTAYKTLILPRIKGEYINAN